MTDKIVNQTIIEVAQKKHISLDDPQYVLICQKFRKVALEVLPSYHVKIVENPAQVKALAVEAGQLMTQKLESGSLQKRYVFGMLYSIAKQIMLLLIIGSLMKYFITVPKERIREWYCISHPCEPDD